MALVGVVLPPRGLPTVRTLPFVTGRPLPQPAQVLEPAPPVLPNVHGRGYLIGRVHSDGSRARSFSRPRPHLPHISRNRVRPVIRPCLLVL